MSHPYHSIDSGGSSSASSGKMNIYLYAYSSDEASLVDDGGRIADTLASRASQLLNEGEVNYYSVERFRSGYYKYPEDEWYGSLSDDDDFEEEFVEFLEYQNGTDNDLHTLPGAHLLVHPGSGCNETDGYYAPDGAEVMAGDAFDEGVAAWSPVCDYNMSLSENAAIQEVLHPFIDDPFRGDEHKHGTINSAGYNRYSVSPMLTYHWDDDVGHCGDLAAETPDTHHQYLTSCTKNEVGDSW